MGVNCLPRDLENPRDIITSLGPRGTLWVLTVSLGKWRASET